MAVLFPTQFGVVLRPDRPAELLQGLLNIENAEGSKNGELTQAQLVDYRKRQFIAVDPNSSVASYLGDNFQAIAGLDGNAASISASDLVQLRQGLPPVQVQPPVPTPPPVNNNFFSLFFSFFQLMLQLLGGLFR